MKKVFCIIVIGWISVFSILGVSACKKVKFTGQTLASLTVTNALVGGPSVRLGSVLTPVVNNNWQQLSVIAGNYELYVWPVGDSTNPYFIDSKFNAEERGVYSLFLAGKSPNIAGIVVKDDIPYHNDSTCGIRIINLVSNSTPLNITLSKTPTVNEVSNLAYQQYTDFKIYPAKAINSSYIFQVRKAADNSILLSYTLITPRFTNVTLAIRGLMMSSPAIGVTRINNDR